MLPFLTLSLYVTNLIIIKENSYEYTEIMVIFTTDLPFFIPPNELNSTKLHPQVFITR